jgi:hypothetical protein
VGWAWVDLSLLLITFIVYQPRMTSLGHLLEGEFAEETEILGGSLSQSHFVHHKSHMTRPRIEPGLQHWRLSYIKALLLPKCHLEERHVWKVRLQHSLLGGSLSQSHFVHHKSHMTRPRIEPALQHWRLSYIKALFLPKCHLEERHVWKVRLEPSRRGINLGT